MPRGLDHIVHAVSDLDAAAEFYRRAGFTVGARNRHPWGTHNHVVQFPGFFIEILTVAEPDKLGGDGLSNHFGIPNHEAIAGGDGFSMLALESTDSQADVADFARSGIGISDVQPFSREAKLPDGNTTTVGFSLVFVRDPLSPNTGFFTCRQQNPAAFWKQDYQRHANGASGVLGAVLAADNPADHAAFLKAFTGAGDLHAGLSGVTAHTPRGDVEIMTPASFHDRYGISAKQDGDGASLKGLRLSVPDIQAAERALAHGGVASRRHAERLIVPPGAAFGATLIFEASGTI
ncbi:hypothetical protein BH10PSE10_BH10PSE10_17140 [soil metagenome]